MAEGQTRKRFTGNLTIAAVEDEAPVTKAGADLSQFTEILSRSWEKVQNNSDRPAMSLSVPADARQLTETRFQQAAKQLNIGCRITFVTPDSPEGQRLVAEGKLTTTQVRVKVQAQARKQVKAKDETNGAVKAAAAPVAKRSNLPKVAAR